MKIRHPLLTKSLGLAGSFAVRAWLGTVPIRYGFLGTNVDPYQKDLRGRYIFSVWHEYLLLPVYRFSRANMYILISHHADGELLKELGRHLRMRLVRGSTTRGGITALRDLIRRGQRSHLALALDGPRGPRRRVQAGAIYIAARTGLEIVPTGIGYQCPWRARSWDRFAVPRPWGLGTFVADVPIRVPPDITRARAESYRRLVEERLHVVSEIAEDWAATGRAPSFLHVASMAA